MAVTDVSTSLPEFPIPPEATITVTTGDASAVVTKLNVYGFTAARVVVPEFDVLPPLLSYGAAQ